MVKTKKVPPTYISNEQEVNMTVAGNKARITSMLFKTRGSNIVKISQDTYFNNNTGEVKQFKHNKNKGQNKNNAKRQFDNLRDLIAANVTDVSHCKWLTLTYREHMTEVKKISRHMENFFDKCKVKFGHFEYIAVVEPNANFSWHVHVIVIFDHKAPFMPNEVVEDCWGRGFTKTKALDKNINSADNLCAYLTAYLADMPIDELPDTYDLSQAQIAEKNVLDENGNFVIKKFLKGARLALYPTGLHIYRTSRGIKRPTKFKGSYGEAKGYIKQKGGKFVGRSATDICDDNDNRINRIERENYELSS